MTEPAGEFKIGTIITRQQRVEQNCVEMWFSSLLILMDIFQGFPNYLFPDQHLNPANTDDNCATILHFEWLLSSVP